MHSHPVSARLSGGFNTRHCRRRDVEIFVVPEKNSRSGYVFQKSWITSESKAGPNFEASDTSLEPCKKSDRLGWLINIKSNDDRVFQRTHFLTATLNSAIVF